MDLGNMLPDQGPPGTEVTVQVQDFPEDDSSIAVYLGDVMVPGARMEQGDTELVFEVPEGAQSGLVTLVVQTNSDQVTAQTPSQFTVEQGGVPRMTWVEPQECGVGMSISITGTNLQKAENVSFTSQEGATRYATPSQVLANRLRVTVPGGLAAGRYRLGGRLTDGTLFNSTLSLQVTA